MTSDHNFGQNQKNIIVFFELLLDRSCGSFGTEIRELKMVAKKVSAMDILYQRKPSEEKNKMVGQNKESFNNFSVWPSFEPF